MAEQMIQHKEGEKVATQAIPTGYKQTEVGVIPKDWEVMLVGDSFTVCNNLRLPISSKVRDGMSGSYPYYGPTKIQGYINEYRVEGEFALIGEDGDHFLKFDSVNQTQLVSGKFNVNNHAHLIKGNVGSAKWFYWFFRNRDISIYLTRQGAGRFKLNKASLERIQCAIPPTEEQLAIATVLSDSDALIVSLGQLIAKKQAIKTATMQQLLTGRTRLPQFAMRPDGTPKGYKSSELGQIPEDWGCYTFNDVVDSCSSGATPYRGNKDFYKGTNRWITSGELNYCIINDTIEKISDEAIKKSNLNVHPQGTFLMAITGLEAAGTRGACGIVGRPATTNQSCMAIYPNEKLSSEYLYYWYVHNGENLAFKYCQGTKQLSYTAGLIKKIPLYLPTIKEEQTAIATILSDMDNELQALTQKLEKARALKQGMMQQLLTGRIRLPLLQEA
ncbi:restriction endonuclease subunit S [Aeromonas hydrophila]|uniref:restriction endonuclease subunit S n=1 Tax=Aeromonas hydrophila TaxID=644 RepID=UPI001933AFF5|nr:restriction endonuclease subunit S [Aeromonas hydrophila]MBM0439847.1 restriction endonuclease subunit S [Aeromonas hydrophila subsp. ranae]MBW3830346.1 restriction endonuclease subunit S [Aeromonas hydrophila]UUM71592.1 restriction endonuclease subunit S [Aeromonas hydrophila]